MWHERMADSGGPQRRALCFLSTLLSQKVPEKSDAVLRCTISGQPKPEVTWYKNGRTIDECGSVSSYEFFENQYVHVLHLYCCTQNDTAVYQVSARNCFGMICCSASIEVQCPTEDQPLSPNPKDDGHTGWKHDTETYEQESPNHTDEKEHPYKEGEGIASGPPTSADAPSSKSSGAHSLQVSADRDPGASGSDNPLAVKDTRQTEEAGGAANTEGVADGLRFPSSSDAPDKQDVCGHRAVHSEVPRLTDGALDPEGPNEEALNSSHQNARVQKYISFGPALTRADSSAPPGTRPVSPPASSTDSDSDYELCPEITLTCAEEFSDDDLEYLECSDVMTDYSNAIWQRNLQGTERVFLLESDDEEMEFSECSLGGCARFFSELGCRPPVSDDTGPMDATAGLCGHHSPPQEVGGRSSRASTHRASSLQEGMPLPLGLQQDGPAMVTDLGRYKPPAALEAAEDGYPGIQGETRDSHQAGKEFSGDKLLNMDKAVAGTEGKHLSGESGQPGMSRCLETRAERRVGGKDGWSQRGSEKPARTWRPGIKGKAKRLNSSLEERTAEASLDRLCPKGPVKHPLTPSDKRVSSHARAEGADLKPQLPAGGPEVPTQAEPEVKTLQAPPGLLSKEETLHFQREGVRVTDVFETCKVSGWSDHPQVQIQETVREQISLSHMPAFSEPTGEEPTFPGTTTESLPNLGGIDKESASLAKHPEVDGCTQGARHEENQGDNTLRRSGRDLGRVLSIPEASSEATSPCELLGPPPQPQAASASPEFAHTVPALETMCAAGPGDGVAVCGPERLEAGDQEACDIVGSPVGAPVGKHLPQEMCSLDLELAGQSKPPDLCPPDDKTLDVLSQTQGPEPPQTTCGSSGERTSPDSPLFISTFTWNISQKASKGATGEDLANIEGSASTSASIVKAGQERLSPSHSGDLEERWPPSPESSSSVWAIEGSDKNSSPGAPDSADIPAGHSPVTKFPREKPTTLIADVECSEVTGANSNTSALSVAPKGHPSKYLAVSVAGDSHAGGPEESSPRAPDGSASRLPSSVQLAHVFNGSTIKSSRELGPMAPSGPGIHVRVPQLPEGEGFGGSSPLQINNLSRKKSQARHTADTRTLEENFQEKGSETAERVQQGSSDDNSQETLPTTSVGQVETNLVPLDCSSASSTERRGQSSGTRVSVVAESPMKDDSQPLSQAPLLSNVLLDKSKERSPGCWEAGKKLKIITLEASVSETWPLGQLTDSGFKGMAAGLIPDRIRAIPDVLKAGAAVPKPGPSKTASACSPQVEYSSAIANNRKIHKREERAGCASWSCLSSQYLSQRRFLESSVDPVEGKKVCVTGLLPEAFRTGRKENANRVSQNRDENRLKRDRPAFFKQLLSCPNILESSVDPTDEMSVGWARVETPEPSESTLGAIAVENKPKGGHLDQRLEVQPAILQVPCAQQSGETPPSENGTNQNQGDCVGWEAGQSRRERAKGDMRSAILPVPGAVQGGEAMPGAHIRSQVQEDGERRSGGPGRSKSNGAALVSPALALSGGLARVNPPSVGVTTHSFTARSDDLCEEDSVEPRNHEHAFSDSEERRAMKSEWKQAPSSRGLTRGPFTSSPERRGIADFSRSHRIEEREIEETPAGETKPTGTSGSPAGPLASVSGVHASAKAPNMLLDPYQQGSTLGHGKKSGEEEKVGPVAAQASHPPPPAAMKSPEVKEKQKTPGSGHLAEGVKKKILSRVAALRLRLEEKEKVRRHSVFESPKPETSVSRTDEKGEPQRPPCQSEGRAPVLLKKIQAEMSPDHSGNVKLSCQFAEIHEDSTISWTKDSTSIAQVQRRAGDNSMVSLAILQASQKDQGLYYCCIKNSYGRVTAEFNLTAEVLKQLSSHPDVKVYEEIEFSQLIFREDFLRDSYFGGRLHGQIATEELHFGEGVHRRAFRSKVLRGLTPVFKPGHACVLKVHNAVAYGARNNEELIQRNYRLAAQECYVQNTARHYAQIYAAEAQPLEGFGEVPEIIPIFLIHRPENNIPYATVEEELIGEFVKYSIRDGKEINFLRRESEAGQKCCTFQHWVYQKTSGCLLVTDMQGVGMKLTDVGIATEATGNQWHQWELRAALIDTRDFGPHPRPTESKPAREHGPRVIFMPHFRPRVKIFKKRLYRMVFSSIN
ncbi:alpha-protein kinase 2 isoform X2 [Bos taurus]|uniref:alpha-protein kinase 2 isoform X2 n=1 Tax=Bos taurus TaxID=9913 RepID=UPI0003841669|nr:alpha-protein kinase 2 isoform X2 [Bos taurus]